MLTLRELLDKAPGAFVIFVIFTFLLYFKNINIFCYMQSYYMFILLYMYIRQLQ